jgi:heat shock protein 4
MPCLCLFVVDFAEGQAYLRCLDGLHPAGMQALYEKECHMALQDKVQEATNEAKNALEAYVYSLRNKLYDQLSDYVTDDFKESTSRKLEQMEVGS